MELTSEKATNYLTREENLEKIRKMAAELIVPGKFVLRLLNASLDFATDFLARVFRSCLVRGHFHLMLSALVLFGPLLSLWVSKYSIFANSHHYLYR